MDFRLDAREPVGECGAGDRVLVTLDDNPGEVVPGRVESIGWGITQGGESPTGTLPDIEPATGWLREPQASRCASC